MDSFIENLGLTLISLLFVGFFLSIIKEIIRNVVLEYSYSHKKRAHEVNKLLASHLKVEPDQLVYKEDEQLKSFFRTKGQLYYHAFTPNGEYYVQFEFEGNKAVDCRIMEQSPINIFDYAPLDNKSFHCHDS